MSAEERVRQVLEQADTSAWTAAALATALDGSGPDELRRHAAEVLAALDIGEGTGDLDRVGAAAQAAAPLLQTAALLRGEGQLWAGQSDEALLAQGRTSAQGPALLARFVFPQLPGLSDGLARPGARMLDVGTGVAALAVAYAEQYPQLTVEGIDVLPRVLALAAGTVAASPVGDRITLREQDVAALDESDRYTLAWLPAPFVPEAAVRAGAGRIARALVPGGWLLVGHGKFAGDPLRDALDRFKTAAYGGTALDDDRAAELLRDAGLTEVRTVQTPPGAPSITAGRRPLP